MKKLLPFFLFFVCIATVAEERQPWSFSHLRRTALSSRLITIYRELLEQVHGLINEGEYDVVSLILQDKISSFRPNTRHPDEFEKLLTLLHIDAARKAQDYADRGYLIIAALNVPVNGNVAVVGSRRK